MTWQVSTGSLKIIQVIGAITSIMLLTVVDHDLNLNYPTMRPRALLITMVCSSFFLSSLVIFMSTVIGSTEVPYSILYRVNGVLDTVGFIVSGLTTISQENHLGNAKAGLFADALRVPNSLTFFADSVIGYEPPIDSPLGVERK